MKVLTILLSFCFFALLLITCSKASDTISTNQTIRDGETIVSADNSFELGFFNTSNTPQNRYLGIWYKKFATGTVVWVANRETPINNRSGELTLKPGGLLVLRDSSTNQIIWSSNTSTDAGNVVARLLDNSNFMVVGSEDGPENYIWQSFDRPTDTLMPEMKVGRNLKRGVVTNYSSWKSDDNPSQGQYMIFMNFSGLPQLFQMKGGNIEYRLGSWNGISFAGSTNNQQLFLRNLFYMDENEIYGGFVLTNKYHFTRLKITPEGNMAQLNWNNRTQEWFLYSSLTTDSCERYAWCGVHGICDIMQSPNCGCLRGFTPKRPEAWENSDWTSGCQREIPLDCGVGEGFRKYSLLKLPDTGQSWFDRNMTLEQCKVKCTNECNCTAYATLDIKLGSGCLLWYNELIDMRTLPSNGQDIYIRMAAIELAKDKRRSGIKRKVWMIFILVSLGFVGLLGLCVYIIIKKNVKAPGGNYPIVEKDDDLELPLFSLFTLSIATDNFSIANKLGEGGFGPVYKGVLEDGKEIAVKRLSIGSTQGVHEFKNEVIFISKLQHRNLVKILGCCIDGEERLLVYEYMANKGLDLYIYQEANRLEWSKLFHILNGIARGLLYLHQDSNLRIIHRDLKAANILLDHDMNPKISDFGLARSFRGSETDTKTKRVVGTYGYMSPEYAGDGIISVKTDVFSFGVLVLEIVSGKRNRGFSHGAHNHNLLGHAWMLYKEGKSLELVDGSPLELNQISEVLCSIQVGLLCVQRDPYDRPNMSVVVAMLNGEGQLPEPKYPGFYMQETSKTVEISCSNNGVTVTLLEAR